MTEWWNFLEYKKEYLGIPFVIAKILNKWVECKLGRKKADTRTVISPIFL